MKVNENCSFKSGESPNLRGSGRAPEILTIESYCLLLVAGQRERRAMDRNTDHNPLSKPQVRPSQSPPDLSVRIGTEHRLSAANLDRHPGAQQERRLCQS